MPALPVRRLPTQGVSLTHAGCVSTLAILAHQVSCRRVTSVPGDGVTSRALEKARWCGLDPVVKWTTLVDLARRGPYLLESPTSSLTSVQTSSRASAGTILGDDDSQVRFSLESSKDHAILCNALPYAARLQLTLSLMRWVCALRDVQDTIAHLRMPYAATVRHQRAVTAVVAPTRRVEYWIDPNTSVHVRMHHELNGTAEQIPAPHTWEPDTTEKEQFDTSHPLPGRARRGVLGGRRRRSASSRPSIPKRADLVRRVQGTVPLPSEDDARARVTWWGSRDRQKRVSARSRSVERAGGLGAADAQRCVPPISFEADHDTDAGYHGNCGRGEGCPFTDDGKLSEVPVHIPCKLLRGARGIREIVDACVMAHAAILSALFVEGRVPRVTTNHPTVLAYIQWAFEELRADRFLSADLHEESAAGQHRPYFPLWADPRERAVLTMIPARNDRITAKEAAYLAHQVLSASPCIVHVQASAAGTPSAAAQQVMKAVRVLQTQLLPSDHEPETATTESGAWSVAWLPVVATDHADGAAPAADSPHRPNGKESAFSPLLQKAGSPTATGWLTTICTFFGGKCGELVKAASCDRQFSRPAVVLHALTASLHSTYLLQVLVPPQSSAVTPTELTQWALHALPSDIRVVGINTTPTEVLYFFPQGSYLTSKVGNAMRYRAINRTIVSTSPHFLPHPDSTSMWRTAARQLLHRTSSSHQFSAHIPLEDYALHTANELQHSNNTTNVTNNDATHALITERTIDYLAQPTKLRWLALLAARTFHI